MGSPMPPVGKHDHFVIPRVWLAGRFDHLVDLCQLDRSLYKKLLAVGPPLAAHSEQALQAVFQDWQQPQQPEPKLERLRLRKAKPADEPAVDEPDYSRDTSSSSESESDSSPSAKNSQEKKEEDSAASAEKASAASAEKASAASAEKTSAALAEKASAASAEPVHAVQEKALAASAEPAPAAPGNSPLSKPKPKQRAEPLEPATVSVKRPTATEKDDEEHAKSKPKLDKVKEEPENATTSGDNVPVSPSPETLAASAIPMLTERPVTVSELDDLRSQVAELTRRQAEAPAGSAGP